jgi:hypothetical protein
MIANILTTAAIHGVQTPQAYRQLHRQHLARLKTRGVDAVETSVLAPIRARIDAGRWMFDCECGAGVAAHPDWQDSRCFGCGNIYHAVVFPPDRAAIEALLLRRPVAVRFWSPGETLADLAAENLAHGVDA